MIITDFILLPVLEINFVSGFSQPTVFCLLLFSRISLAGGQPWRYIESLFMAFEVSIVFTFVTLGLSSAQLKKKSLYASKHRRIFKYF